MEKKKIKICAEVHLVSFHDYAGGRMLIFKKTCSASPAQYDVYDSWNPRGKKKYYGRLRWGCFTLSCAPLTEPLFTKNFRDKLKGCFNSPVEELECLQEACAAVWDIHKKSK